MTEFFKDAGQENKEQKTFIPPDYSEHTQSDIQEKEIDDDSDIDDLDIVDEDEGEQETLLDSIAKNKEQKKDDKFEEGNKGMTTSPFSAPGTQQGNSTPSWQQPNNSRSSGGWTTPSWAQNNNSGNNNPWQSKPNSTWGGTSWGGNNNTPSFGQNSQKQEINRAKKVVFCDFLDCLVETYQSNGQPGLRPRDIYDLKPRLDVWFKLAAINPERIYAMIPENVMPASTNGINGLELTLSYFCCSVSSFLKVPYTNCQILAQSAIGQPKSQIMLSVIDNPRAPIKREDIIMVGIYSGLYGLSNIDAEAARECGIDYVDLSQLLNSF